MKKWNVFPLHQISKTKFISKTWTNIQERICEPTAPNITRTNSSKAWNSLVNYPGWEYKLYIIGSVAIMFNTTFLKEITGRNIPAGEELQNQYYLVSEHLTMFYSKLNSSGHKYAGNNCDEPWSTKTLIVISAKKRKQWNTISEQRTPQKKNNSITKHHIVYTFRAYRSLHHTA